MNIILCIPLLWAAMTHTMQDIQTKYFFDFVDPTPRHPQRNYQPSCKFLETVNDENEPNFLVQTVRFAQARDINLRTLYSVMRKCKVQCCIIQQKALDRNLVTCEDDDKFIAEPLKLSNLLDDNFHLKSLYLQGSKLTIDAVDLSNALKNAYITNLKLGWLTLPKKDIPVIFEALKSSIIRRLVLYGICVDDGDDGDVDDDMDCDDPYAIDVIPYLLDGNNQNLRRLEIDYLMIPGSEKSLTDFSNGAKKSNLQTLTLLDVPHTKIDTIKHVFFPNTTASLAFLDEIGKKHLVDNAQFRHLCFDVKIVRENSAFTIERNTQKETIILKASS